MEFNAFRISIGNIDILNLPVKVKVSKSGLSFDNPQFSECYSVVAPVVIQKKDIKKIEHSQLAITSPFLCLYLTSTGCAKIWKRIASDSPETRAFCQRMEKLDLERRVFIILDLEYLSIENLTKPLKIVRFLHQNFLQTKFKELGCQDAGELLKRADLKAFSLIFMSEYVWFLSFCDLPESEKAKYECVKTNINRKISSYTLFVSYDATKEAFLSKLKSLKTHTDLNTFLRTSLFWPSQLIIEQCLDFISDHQCSSPACGKFSLVKCSACKVARYCDQECQLVDFEKHNTECLKLKKMRKQNPDRKVAIDFSKSFSEATKKDILSYEYFVSNIGSKIFEFYGDLVISDPEYQKDIALRNLTNTDSLPEYIDQFKDTISMLKK